jgi:hypothetical protein
MSDNLPVKKEDALPPEPTTDIRPEEMNQLMAYIEEGLPGVDSVGSKKQQEEMYNYYADGHSYASVARCVKVRKEIVLYFAHKFNWYDRKKDYLRDLADSIEVQKVTVNLVAQEATLKLFSYYRAKFGDAISEYMVGKNPDAIRHLDPKEVGVFLRLIEIFRENPNSPLLKDHAAKIGIYVGNGIDVKGTGPNSVQLTPKQKSAAEFLEEFATYERANQEQKEKEKLDMVNSSSDTDSKDE